MSNPIQTLCRICKVQQAEEWNSVENRTLILSQKCPNCGQWWGPADVIGPDLGNEENSWLLPFLAAHIRQTSAANKGKVVFVGADWKDHAAEHARTPIPRKLDMVLQWFERQTRFAGDFVQREPTMVPLVDAANAEELIFLTTTLSQQGLLEWTHAQPGERFQITAKGWNYLRPIGSGGIAGTAFIAMSFATKLTKAYLDGIVPATEACGFSVNRVDRTPHNDQITDRIIAGLRSAQFVVADFTGQRQSVYYEAGFAQGLGKPVIRTCRDTDFKKLHFDTRQYLHIKWSTAADLRTKLEEHIRATIGNLGSAEQRP